MSLPNNPSFKAGGTINVGRCVKVSADNTVVQCTAAADVAVGIAARSMRDAPGLTGSDNSVAASSGDAVMVYGPGSVAPAISGAAVTVGAKVSPDANGKVIDAIAASSVIGIALEAAGAADVEIQVLVAPQGIF